jgi:hypothetical protein
MCQCLACEHEQWIKPLNLKGKYRSLCKECEYPKDCECGKPIEQNADFRFFLCSDCRENRSLKRARISSLKKNLAMKLARSHGFDPSPDEGTAWKTWAESLGVNLDNLAKEILEDVTTDGS